MKKIKRDCNVCGRGLEIIVNNDRSYLGGHFFGRLKIPVEGTGEYKKIETSEIFGYKSDVIKWTGKEKKAEYWECDSCYNKK